MPGVNVRFDGFMGTIGVAPGPAQTETWFQREAQLAAAGGFALGPQPLDALPAAVCGPSGTHQERCLRTVPPRENGGNMDVKQMQVGTTLLLPCFVDGCLCRSATCTSRRATARFPARPSKWTRR